MESIQEIAIKIKSLAKSNKVKDLLSFSMLFLVGLGSFMLGRQSTLYSTDSKISIYEAREVIHTQNKTSVGQQFNEQTQIGTKQVSESKYSQKGNYLASSRGKKYYPVDCPASKNIKEENRIYFEKALDAENKGYTLSTSCE